MILVVVVLLLLSIAVCCFPSYLAQIFSKDDQFVQGVVEASIPLASLMVTMNLTVALEVFSSFCNVLHIFIILIQAIVSSLGKTRHLLVSGLIGSWVGQVPVCFLFSIFWRNDIIGRSHSIDINLSLTKYELK